MSTVKGFSDKERAYDACQARQNYLRMQGSINRYQQELKEALAQERQEKESALQEKDAALAEIARLQALLRCERPQGDD